MTISPAFDSPDHCRLTLDRIRLGQPSSDLMLALNARTQSAIDYLGQRFKQRTSITRLIAGSMGRGKSTLCDLIEREANQHGAIPIKLVINHQSTSTVRAVFAQVLIRPALYQAAIKAIMHVLSEGNPEYLANIRNSFANSRLPALFEGLISAATMHHASQTEPPSTTGSVFSSSVYSLIHDTRVTPIRVTLQSYGVDGRLISTLSAQELNDLIKTHLDFFNACNIYPVWLIDEFESVCGLSSRYVQDNLGFYRDMLDLLMAAPAKSGAIFLFSTEDGVRAIDKYPALADRLRGGARFTMANPTWQMSHFSQWDTVEVLQVFRSIYAGAAAAGDSTAIAVTDNAHYFKDPRFLAAANNLISRNDLEPRLRLKGLICNILDVIECGVHDFEIMLDELALDASDVAIPQAETTDSVSPQLKDSQTDAGADYQGNEPATASEDAALAPTKRTGLIADILRFLTPSKKRHAPETNPALAVSETVKAFSFYTPQNLSTADALTGIKKASSISILAARLASLRDEGGRLSEIATTDDLGVPMLCLGDLSFFPACDNLSDYLERALAGDGLQSFVVSRLQAIEPDEISFDEIDVPDIVAKKPKSKLVHAIELVRIDESPSRLRHSAYNHLCHQGNLLPDVAVDDIVLSLLFKHRNFVPATSRNGVVFIVAGRELLASGAGYTCISDALVLNTDHQTDQTNGEGIRS